MYGRGFWGVLLLIADVWAIINIVQSNADTTKKVLWTVGVLIFPIVGFIFWLALGPRAGRA
ncbi:MAG: PLDc_N domain-containing protein [Proteobacteria bacterium]|nr:PLDc_N domain-containing protein [Pseudomonadota bacterium]